jgi:hypothetical protein
MPIQPSNTRRYGLGHRGSQFPVEITGRGVNLSTMRPAAIWLLLCWVAIAVVPAEAATGRIVKVLPHFLDSEGRHALSPSLYDRDAYQAFLREHPQKRSGIRFDVEWKLKGPAYEPLKLRVELRGIAKGKEARQLQLEEMVEPPGLFSRWSGVTLSGQAYQAFGEITAWRVTLWEKNELLAEQKSFLW